MTRYHTPVLINEALDSLQMSPGRVIIDGTLGGGGHAREILKGISPGGTLIGFDRDQDAIDHAETWKQPYGESCILIHDNFAKVLQYRDRLQKFPEIHGCILDLGISSHQLDGSGRGFSFRQESEPLDMRMDTREDRTAAVVLNTATEQELFELLRDYGEEPNARRIARQIVERRKTAPLQTVVDLLNCVAKGYRGRVKPKSHMATRTFQAIRIAVNRELQQLPQALVDMISLLAPGGRCAVITFHSLEDRIVKQTFVKATKDCLCPSDFPECRCDHRATVRKITKKPIVPTEIEIGKNPRARSAKLRVIEKL